MLNDFDINDDGKLYNKYRYKCTNARKAKVRCLLSYKDYCDLVRKAGIVSSQIGYKSKDKYVLGRYNDIGDYTKESCRFITQLQNVRERKLSEETLKSFSDKLYNYRKNRSKEQLLIDMKKVQESRHRNAIKRQKIRREEFLKTANMNYVGEKNSQYNTCWITDGYNNRKIKKNDLLFYNEKGWVKGRTTLKNKPL